MNLIIDFFLIGGMGINVLILLLLYKARKKGLPQKLLFFFFGIVFFYTLHIYADTHKLNVLFIATFIFNDIIELFAGPVIFLYIKSLFEDNKDLVKRNLMHFVPLIIYVLAISIPVLVSLVQREFVFKYLAFINSKMTYSFLFFILYLLFYLALSLRLFFKYRSAMKFNFSNLSEDDFGWVKHMLIGVIVVCLLDLFSSSYELFIGEVGVNTEYLTLMAVVVLLAYLGYYGVNQTKILIPDFLLQQGNNENLISRDEVISKDEIEELEHSKNKLLSVLEKDRVFLDEELTLNKLASFINISDKKLSYLLNQYMHTTFYDFVNAYRIQSVKDKLASQDFEHLTLLGIAYESGFKSKTSFNRIFKKETGKSPSEYKKSIQK